VARYAILTRRRTTNLRPRTDASAVSARARAHALPSRARAHTCTHHAYMERRCGEWERKPKVWPILGSFSGTCSSLDGGS
jgi:hypothetical protein